MPSYNPYFPVTYQQPYYAYNPVPQQPVQQQPQQSGIIWIANEKEAALYPIAPNNAVALWSQSEPVVYMKQADASGRPSMKIYDLVERKDPETTAPAVEYATKTDLNALIGTMQSFDSSISSIRTDLDVIRSDVYGIAGKKKRKVEDDDAE